MTQGTNECSSLSKEEREKLQVERRDYTLKQVGASLAVLSPAAIALFQGLQSQIAAAMQAQGFWTCNNTGEKIALMHSELSEGLEADRKKLQDQHLPHHKGITVELADTVIRILDFAGYHNLDLGQALIEKMQYNLSRSFMHGKGY